jgi:hypothetical protein
MMLFKLLAWRVTCLHFIKISNNMWFVFLCTLICFVSERFVVLIQVWWLYHHWFFMCVQLLLCGVSVWHNFQVVNLVFVSAIAHIPLVTQHSVEPGACANRGSRGTHDQPWSPRHLIRSSMWHQWGTGAEQGTSIQGLFILLDCLPWRRIFVWISPSSWNV